VFRSEIPISTSAVRGGSGITLPAASALSATAGAQLDNTTGKRTEHAEPHAGHYRRLRSNPTPGVHLEGLHRPARLRSGFGEQYLFDQTGQADRSRQFRTGPGFPGRHQQFFMAAGGGR